MKYITTVDGRSFEIQIDGEDEILVQGEPRSVDFRPVLGQQIYSLLINGLSHEALVRQMEGTWQVLLRGRLYTVTVEDERERRLRQVSGIDMVAKGELKIKSPMPGMIVAVPVKPDQEVEKGATLVILESMKMQNELKAPRAGNVRSVHVRAGDNVEQNQVLVVLA
jgi:biotin carboxyl carrier protein